MANSRKDGIDKVNELLNPIIWHLIKIAVYNNPKDRAEQVEHWEGEILNWLEQIFEFCSNLKRNNSLKFRDYILCLTDDLSREVLVRSKFLSIRRQYKGQVIQDPNHEHIRKQLWAILEQQFKAMADGSWSNSTLLDMSIYKNLKESL